MQASTVLLAHNELEAVRGALMQVYGAAFALPPWNEPPQATKWFADRMDLHAQRAGFRCCLARDTATEAVVGFTYGYTCAPGQWWYDIVTPAFSLEEIGEWFIGAFEMVELAVLPSAHRQGIGGQLHDALLSGLTHTSAVTATRQTNQRALRLYQRHGWQVLRSDFQYPQSSQHSVILGRMLPLQAQNEAAHEA